MTVELIGMIGVHREQGGLRCFCRGFDPVRDACEFGRELMPLLRAEVAGRHTAVARKEAL